MTRPQRYTPEEVVRALHACYGKAYLAARLLKCSANTIYNYVEKYPEVRAATVLGSGWTPTPVQPRSIMPRRARRTAVDGLPAELRAKLDGMLDERLSYDAITRFFQVRGHRLSRSGVARYAANRWMQASEAAALESQELAKDLLRKALLDRLAAELLPRLEAKRAELAQANDDTVAGYARSLGLGEVEWHEPDGEHGAGYWLVCQNELQYLGAEDGAARAVLDSLAALAELGLL